MKVSEMFEGENSSLKKTFDKCVNKDLPNLANQNKTIEKDVYDLITDFEQDVYIDEQCHGDWDKYRALMVDDYLFDAIYNLIKKYANRNRK